MGEGVALYGIYLENAFTLAAVSVTAAQGGLPIDNGAPRIIFNPLVAAASVLAAAAELGGDKMNTAPDRIVPIGLAARFITSAIAGAALVPYRERRQDAALGGATAVLASYFGWRARVAAMPRYGQTPTGLVEDAVVIASAIGVVGSSCFLKKRPKKLLIFLVRGHPHGVRQFAKVFASFFKKKCFL